MTDATNTDEVITTVDEQVEVTESTEESSNSVAGEQQKDTAANPVQGRINKLTAKAYQAQREAEALKAENDALKKQLTEPAQTQEQLVEPVMPDDIYDESAMRDFHNETAKYNKNLMRQEVASNYQTQQESAARSQQQASAQKAREESISKYVETGLSDGLSVEQMQENEQVIIQSGMKPEVGDFLMSDPNAAKVADYLAKNPLELAELNSLSAMQAAVKLNTLRQNALAQGNFTKAPDPIQQNSGGGGKESDDLDGLVFV